MKVLVTGGAGFIGSHLCDRLVADGHRVTVLDNLATGTLENLAGVRDQIEWIEGDLRDRVAVERAARGVEVVFHQAALASVARSLESPREATEVNVTGTLNVLVAARDAKARRVVFASSSSVYGDTPELPKRESMALAPRSPYAASKVAGEAYVSAFHASFGLEGVSLRYFNVYGPRQSPRSLYAAVVPCFVEAMTSGRAPTIFGDGLQTRDFTYVADVVDALLRAASSGSACDAASPACAMNVGGGRRVSILELAKTIGRAAGFQADARHEPARAGDVRDSLADIARARERLAWEPKTSLDDGIARVVAAAKRSGAPTPAR